MRHVYLSLIFLFGFLCQMNAQIIFKGLEAGMTESEAKDEFKDNKDIYTNIQVGNDFDYRIYRQNFIFSSEKLFGIVFSPKGAAMGQTYDNCVSYLNYTRNFLEKLNFNVFSEPQYWNAPLNFNSKYGLLMVNEDETVVAQLYPTSYEIYGKKSFLVKLELYNYEMYMDIYDKAHAATDAAVQSSGF